MNGADKRVPNPKTAQEAKERGNVALASGNYDEAVAMYSIDIAMDPRNHVLYSNRSACYCGLRKYDDALADATKCIDMKKDWGKVRRHERGRRAAIRPAHRPKNAA